MAAANYDPHVFQPNSWPVGGAGRAGGGRVAAARQDTKEGGGKWKGSVVRGKGWGGAYKCLATYV